jgi:hypothetical protein
MFPFAVSTFHTHGGNTREKEKRTVLSAHQIQVSSTNLKHYVPKFNTGFYYKCLYIVNEPMKTNEIFSFAVT